MAKNQIKREKNDSKYAEDWLPITNIQGGMIEVQGRALEGKQIVTGVRVEPKNIFISDDETQNRTIYALENFYNSLDYEFWLICCDRPVDINLFKSELEVALSRNESAQTRKLIIQDLQKCDMFTGPAINAVDTEFYLLFKDSPKNMERIQKRVHNMISGLASAGLVSRQITEEDIRVLLDSFLNDSKRIEYGTVMSDV